MLEIKMIVVIVSEMDLETVMPELLKTKQVKSIKRECIAISTRFDLINI